MRKNSYIYIYALYECENPKNKSTIKKIYIYQAYGQVSYACDIDKFKCSILPMFTMKYRLTTLYIHFCTRIRTTMM